MATFEAQVEGLTSLSIDGSSAPTQTELTQFLTDGAKEILTALPTDKKMMYSTSSALDNSTTYLTLGGSEVLGVMRDDGTINQPCRRIPSSMSGRAQDSAEMTYGTTSDPVWWVVNNILSIFPEPSSEGATVQTLAYPAVAYGDSSITKFPDEAEYLVPIYASIKSLQNAMAAKAGNSDITTALTAINTELDETQAICDLINTQVDAAVVELAEAVTLVDTNIDTATTAINTAVDRVNTAVQLANTQFDSAVSANSSEDIELASSHVTAGNGYISEAQASISEAQGFVAEVSARVNQTNAQVGVAGGYLSSAQGYLNEIQGKTSIANGYASEITSRLNVISVEYTWMEKQQAKLQADYDKGLQIVMAG